MHHLLPARHFWHVLSILGTGTKGTHTDAMPWIQTTDISEQRGTSPLEEQKISYGQWCRWRGLQTAVSAAGPEGILTALVLLHPWALASSSEAHCRWPSKHPSNAQNIHPVFTCTYPASQNVSGYVGTQILKPERPESIYVLLYLPIT